MFLGGKKWIPRGLNQTQQTKRQPINQSVAELMKPLGEKTWQGNVWGSAIMNVQKGQPTPQPTTYLLDTYTGSSAAYSVRRLSSTYSGPAIRVRRVSDGAEQDISFTDGDLDTTLLMSFVGSSTGTIKTWYDQSGNGWDLDGFDAGRQPIIVSGGTLLTQSGKPAVKFDGIGTVIWTPSTGLGIQNIKSFYSINTPTNETTGNARTLFSTGFAGAGSVYVGLVGGTTRYQYWIEGSNNQSFNFNISYNTPQNLSGFFADGTTNGIKRYLDGNLDVQYTLDYANNAAQFKFAMGASDQDFNYWWCGYQQELVLFSIDNSSNRTAIENNQTTYF